MPATCHQPPTFRFGGALPGTVLLMARRCLVDQPACEPGGGSIPEPIRLADEVLKTRHAMADAQRILAEADDTTREPPGPHLEALKHSPNPPYGLEGPPAVGQRIGASPLRGAQTGIVTSRRKTRSYPGSKT
jgi:hypothetical protein